MITLEMLKAKRDLYEANIAMINSTDVEAEVDKRLQLKRDDVRKEVIAELKADELACKHYLEILDVLISSDVTAVESNASDETVVDVDSENNISEVNYESGANT